MPLPWIPNEGSFSILSYNYWHQKDVFQRMKNHFRGQSATWFLLNHTPTSALQSYFTRFSSISLKFRYHYITSVCPKHNWKAFKFDKANFPDLGPTVISDQIFSHILKAPDDVKQNHLSHSLSLYSIKFQQEIFNDCEASHFHPIYYAGWFFLCNFVIGIWDNCFLKFFLPPLVLASFLYILRSAPRVYWEDKINCLYV